MILPINIFLPSVILDSIGIGVCILAICIILIFSIYIIIRRQLMQSKENILFLLSLNMFISVFIFTILLLDMFVLMMRGHLIPEMSIENNQTLGCQLKVYLASITIICSLYSNTIQALYRFFRIIYYTHPILHRNIYYYIFCIFFQIFLSALQALPILLFGEFQYDDYHCQVLLTSWRGVILAIILIWLFPVSSTFTIYMRTMRYVLLNSANFTFRQKTRIERDFTVIKRVVWLLSFIILCGIPSICLSLIYFIFGYISWWETYLCWLTFLLSFMGMIVVHIYYAPHLRNLWRKRRNNVNPTLMRLTTYR